MRRGHSPGLIEPPTSCTLGTFGRREYLKASPLETYETDVQQSKTLCGWRASWESTAA
jgi:hypothetical protein